MGSLVWFVLFKAQFFRLGFIHILNCCESENLPHLPLLLLRHISDYCCPGRSHRSSGLLLFLPEEGYYSQSSSRINLTNQLATVLTAEKYRKQFLSDYARLQTKILITMRHQTINMNATSADIILLLHYSPYVHANKRKL